LSLKSSGATLLAAKGGCPLTITKNANWGTYADTYGTGPRGFRVIQLGAKIYFLGPI